MKELIPNFDANLAQTLRTAKRESYNDRKLEFDNDQLTMRINKENGVKDFFNWFVQNQNATDEQIQEYALKAIQDNNIEGSGGLEFLSNASNIKGYMKSLKEVTTDPDVAQEFMAQAAAGELDYEAFSKAIVNKQINYKEAASFMSRDKSVNDHLQGKFNQEVKEFSKNYLTKGGGYYKSMDSKTRQAATTAMAAIQDKVTTGEMTPEEGQKALRDLKEKAIPNMVLSEQIRKKNIAILTNGRYRSSVAIPTGNSDKALAAFIDAGIVRNAQGVRNNSITFNDIPTNDRNKDGVTGDVHLGFDINGVYIGQPIYAPTDGQVVSAGKEATMGYYAVVKTKKGYMLAMHLKEPVMNGLKIKRNEPFGYVGNTGRVYGDAVKNGCLHVEFWDENMNLLFPEK
jgi:murein DD-endopeptidase MepM/ murein hydrolase activator NlpD